MKRKLIITALAITVTAAILFNNDCQSVNLQNGIDNGETIAESETEYTIADYKGRIAVFEKGMATPIDVYDIFTSSMPEPDRIMLKKGIEIKNESELEEYLADFTS